MKPSHALMSAKSRLAARHLPLIDGVVVVRGGIAVLCGVALAYQLATLGRQGLWYDELYTEIATDPREGLATLFRDYMIADPHPPLYYLLMYGWRQVTPASDWWLRLPGGVVYVLTVLAAAGYPSRQLSPPARRLLFTGLVACSFGTLYFSHEVRAYSLAGLFAVPVTLDAATLFAALRGGGNLPRGAAVRLALVGLLASWVDYFSFLFFGANILVLTICALRLRRPAAALRLAGIGAAVLALFGPWLVVNVAHLNQDYFAGVFWTPPLAQVARGFLRHLVGGLVPLLLLLAIVVAALRRRGWRGIPEVPVIGMVAASMAVTLLVIGLLSLYTPLLNERYLTPLRPAIYFVLALAAGDLLAERGVGWLGLAAVAALLGSAVFEQKPKTSWREPADFVRWHTSCAHREILAFPTELREAMLRWYLPEPRFAFRASAFDPDRLGAELARLAPTAAPGCDVVAIALNLNVRSDEAATILRRTPFGAPPYRLDRWPGSFVVRYVGPPPAASR
jgi:hypothetical protein